MHWHPSSPAVFDRRFDHAFGQLSASITAASHRALRIAPPRGGGKQSGGGGVDKRRGGGGTHTSVIT